jgi:RNA polymerase sigma-70 factor (ECF subfamily)
MNNEARRRARFNGLAEAHGADLYRYALWICGHEALAKDLVQETYVRAWKALDRLQNEGAAKSWLLTILRREFARSFERKVPRFTGLDEVEIAADAGLEPDERTEIQLLRRNILQLPPKYREPLLLQVVMGYDCEEIAGLLAIRKNAVLTRLFRAREQLRERLSKDGVTDNVHELF